jgi:regulator of nucleoside diphosphate kinase
MTEQRVLITTQDSQRLHAMLSIPREAEALGFRDRLERRLAAAEVIDRGSVPRSLVTMNSLVGLRDVAINQKFSCTLVYPDEADVVKHKVSVAVPLGTGMLGARVGDMIQCTTPSGTRSLRIEHVFYQPEAARDFHL